MESEWTKLAEGDTGIVFKRTLPDGRDVAIKVFNDEDEWRHELSVLRHIDPSNTLYVDSAYPTITTEYIHGSTLFDLFLDENGKRDKSKGAQFELIWTQWVQLLEEVQALHRKGVAHRDLHLGNIIWTGKDIRLIDFGNAVISATTEDMDNDIHILGLQLAYLLQWTGDEILLGYKSSLWGEDENPDLAKKMCTLVSMLLSSQSLGVIIRWMKTGR
jgi:tRNA A-37 threonylcarbamoyl transferase component Bud32